MQWSRYTCPYGHAKPGDPVQVFSAPFVEPISLEELDANGGHFTVLPALDGEWIALEWLEGHEVWTVYTEMSF